MPPLPGDRQETAVTTTGYDSPMIAPVPSLTRPERAAVAALIRRALHHGEPRLTAALLFGSKARGDFRRDSDVDILALCAIDPEERDAAAALLAAIADDVHRSTGVRVEPWAVPEADLRVGARTPMLVDALADGIPLWPPSLAPIRIRFTWPDAVFCANCLLEWVEEGGAVVRRALRKGRWDEAAGRARDDITRLATAALLLNGDTRHRRAGSLRRFETSLVRTGIAPARVRPALAWAAAAFPTGHVPRGRPPPVPAAAARTAPTGYALAQEMERCVVPLILDWMDGRAYPVRRFSSAASSSDEERWCASIRKIPSRWAIRT